MENSFAKLERIMQISICYNKLTGGFPMLLKSLYIFQIQFRSNKLHSTIPSYIVQMTNLWELDISDNDFTGALDSHMFNYTAITCYNLSHNHFEGKCYCLLVVLNV